MSKVYYIENKNGTFFSENGKRRFVRLEGKGAYHYLNGEGKSKKHRFMLVNDDGGEFNRIYVEIPKNRKKDVRQEERRKQYVSEIICQNEYTVISFDNIMSKNGEILSGEEIIANNSEDMQEQVYHKIMLETLHTALQSLSEDDRFFILSSFDADNRITEREWADTDT